LWIRHVVIGALVALLSEINSEGFDPESFFLRWLIAMLACTLLLPLWPQVRFKNAVRNLTVDESGFQTSIGTLSGSRAWREIDRVEDAGGEILLVGKNGNAMVVPNRAFSSPEERAVFLRDVRSWHGNMPYNKPLVPTRNGEAPLLAAQRRR
jgi:hypothetical protein